MWSPIVFCLLVGLISASTSPAWKDNKEYVYKILGRTLASLDIANEFSGILMKASLRIQTRPDGKLQCLLVNPQYAQIHSELSEGALTYIPSAEVSWKPMELTKKPFQIEMKRGVITDLIVSKSTSNWEANIIKGIVSQFQLNINQYKSYNSQNDNQNDNQHDSALFVVLEETVSGNTETQYEVSPVPDHLLLNSEIIPDFQEMKEDEDETLEVTKHKNYTNSVELPSYVYGLGDIRGEISAANVMGKFFIRSTTTKALVTGSLKQFTIQNSFTINEISVSPTFVDTQAGSVTSMWNATLEKVQSPSQILEDVPNPTRLGGLVYSYGKPYSQSNAVNEKHKDRDYSQYQLLSWRSSSQSPEFYNEYNEQGYQAEPPQINEASASPFLPYTIGNQGRSLKSGTDVVKSVVSMAQEIGTDLQEPKRSLKEDTLSKFVTLIELIRIMDEEELRKAGKELVADKKYPSRHAAHVAFRDAVAESGSSPALLVIQGWIETKNVEKQEAAYIISVMANAVQEPTSEYIRIFFELIKKPVVTSQWPLNETAILSFAELTRRVYLDDSYYQTNYPVKSFKNLSGKQGLRYVKDTIIPYFTQRLHKAVSNDEPNKIHTYIRALGYIGDPEILKAYEPYLEGKKHCSQYQRALMVISMGKLVLTSPEVARNILFKIYKNTGEYQVIRVAAVYQLMRTKPPLAMVLHMAAYTKIDTQETVNAAVKTSIETAAELSCDGYQHLRYAARMAKHLLTETEYGLHQGGNYLKSYFAKHIDLQNKEATQILASTDSFYPRGIKYAWRLDDASTKYQIINVQAFVSSIEQLVRLLNKETQNYSENKQQQQQKSEEQKRHPFCSQNIARILNMKAEVVEQLEASVFFMDWNLPYKMFSLNNDTISQLPGAVKDWEKKLQNKEINYLKFTNGDDVIIALPTEMGIPFVFTYNAPNFYKVQGQFKAVANPKVSQNGKIHKPKTIKLEADVHVTVGSKRQGHLSFITPFDHQQYYSGFEKQLQVSVPIVGTLKLDFDKNEIKIEIQPEEKTKGVPLIHYSTWPFTSRKDIMNLKNLVAQNHNQYIKPDHLRSIDTVYGKKNTGLAYRVQIEHDRATIKMSDIYDFYKNGPLEGLRNVWNDADIQYSQCNITYLPQESSANKIVVKLGYEQDYSEKGESEPINWEQISRATKSSQRKETLLKGVSADINNVQSYVVDASISFQGDKTVEYIYSTAYAKSSVDPKSRVYGFFKHSAPSGKYSEGKLKIVNNIPNTNVLNLDDAFSTEPKAHSKIDFKFESNADEETNVKADIKFTRSNVRKQYLKDQPMYQECKRDMRLGNNQSPACVNLTVEADYLDKIDIDVKFDNVDNAVEDFIETVFDHFKYENYPTLKINRTQSSAPENQIKVQARIDSDLRYTNISVKTNEQETTFIDVELGEYSQKIFVMHPTYDVASRWLSKVLEINTIYPVCVVDQTQVTTFNNWTYDALISEHWTVMAQLVPRRAGEREQIYSVEKQLNNQLSNIVILVRESQELQNNKELKIVISSPHTDFEIIDITATPNQESSSGPKGTVTVNQKQIEVTDSYSKDIKDGYYQIYTLSNGEIKIEIGNNHYYVIYDGHSIRLEVTSDILRGSIRGICGQFNGQQNEDTLTPQNCFARDTEKFVKSYEVEGQKGQQVRKELSGDSNECVEKNMPLYIDLITPKDTAHFGPKSEKYEVDACTRHANTYSLQGNDICFTTELVIVCKPNCKALRYETKEVPVYCLSQNDNYGRMWRAQLDAGNTPKFHNKAVLRKLQIQVPQACSAY